MNDAIKSYCRLRNIKGGGVLYSSHGVLETCIRYSNRDIKLVARDESGNSEIHFGKSTV